MKQLTAIILTAILMLSAMTLIAYADTPVQPEPTEPYLLGDSDGDGIVTVLDATKIQRILAVLDEDPDGMITLRGAVDGAATLNIMHATAIQRYLADFEVSAPVGTWVYPGVDPTEAQTEPTMQGPTRDPDELPFVPKN